jgi:hypothetical protein
MLKLLFASSVVMAILKLIGVIAIGWLIVAAPAVVAVAIWVIFSIIGAIFVGVVAKSHNKMMERFFND